LQVNLLKPILLQLMENIGNIKNIYMSLQKTIKVAFIIQLTLFLTACLSLDNVSLENYHQKSRPPNGVKILENFYCDKTEISNLDWAEYVFWNKNIFGKESEEYLSSLPDTNVWLELDSCYKSLASLYFRHPTYSKYPVIGISQKQAVNYSKWRSDRVFEFLLIKYDAIKYNENQTKDNYFTIEKYFKGEIEVINQEKKTIYYPEFRLPNLSERKLILNHSDSLYNLYSTNCTTKKCKDCYDKYPEIWSNAELCDNDKEPTISRITYNNCVKEKLNLIYNLRGNVSEWLFEEKYTAGGSWKNTFEEIMENEIRENESPNAFTGFRNVCEWKKWKN